MNWIARLDVIVLALLLAYIVTVVIRVSFRYHMARRVQGIDSDSRSLRKLTANLGIEIGNLKSIASIAPYLGLAGACVGIMDAFGGIGMEKHAAEIMITSRVSLALVTTAAGILVAVTATCFYNCLRTRIDLLESEVANEAIEQGSRSSQVIQRLPLARRFSQLPAFALIAAPCLAILVAVHTPFFAPRRPTGFGIDLASARCEYRGDDRLIVLHITDAGKLFINTEQEDWNGLAGRLSEIYSTRVQRTLYLVADDGVSFQTVADAIDIANNGQLGGRSSSLDITVRLITPRAINAHCREPVVTGAGQHL
jgi:biopolymer transport protein ExbD